MRLSTIAAGLVLAGTLSLPSFAAGTTDVSGNWKDPDTGAILAFADCDGDLCAKILTPSSPDMKDDKNPDASKRATPLAGLAILSHAKKSDDTSWKGDLYNTNDGKTYSGYVTFTAPDKLQLKGCALLIFCKTLVLSKAP
jgi:uncharacterized protein (DUF2147 family)